MIKQTIAAVAALTMTAGAQALTRDQAIQTCQAKRNVAQAMMEAYQAGTDQAELEYLADEMPPIAGETGRQLLERVYEAERVPEGQRGYTVAVFAAQVYTECNDKITPEG